MIIFLLVACSSLFGSIDLEPYEASLYSENGEDGIIAKIFQLARPNLKYCVDLGAGDGITSNLTYLLALQGWKSLLIDRAHRREALNLKKEFLTAGNLNAIFEKYRVPLEFDFLTIDVRYNDYYLWKALDAKYRPSLVAISYNATLGADLAKVVQYHPYFIGDGTSYFGASILALYQLARDKGYSLIYVDKNGCTLFFFRDDLLQEKNLSFLNMNEVQKLYRPCKVSRHIKEGVAYITP